MVHIRAADRWQCHKAGGTLRRTATIFLLAAEIFFSFLAAALGDSPVPTTTLVAAASAEKPAQQTAKDFESEWAKLIAAAKQEGTVAIASGGAPSRQYRPVIDVFQKKFGVKVEMSTGSATDTVKRRNLQRLTTISYAEMKTGHAKIGGQSLGITWIEKSG